MGISELTEPIPKSVTYIRYGLLRGNSPGLHPWLVDVDSKLVRGESCACAAHSLKQQGFEPELICAHPGWGEALFLADIWPNVPLLTYQEFYYQSCGFDYDFDPELQGVPNWQACASMRLKNANVLLNLQASRWSVTPTFFQRSTFPSLWHSCMSVIHDGIDTQLASPDSSPSHLLLPDGTTIRRGDSVVTFVNRHIEPYRGCHTFLRSVPTILRRHPHARIVIVGQEQGVSYGRAAPCGSWKEVFLAEIEDQADLSRLHFTGSLSYDIFLKLLKITSCHVYLTYPFVLSWSMLEAMSCGAALVGSSTSPVQEVIRDGWNGLLVDFFSPADLAEAVIYLLNNPENARELGTHGRDTVLNSYSTSHCVPRHLQLMNLVASGVLGS